MKKATIILLSIFILSLNASTLSYKEIIANVTIELAEKNYKGAYASILPAINNKKQFKVSQYEDILWYAAYSALMLNDLSKAEFHLKNLISSQKKRNGSIKPSLKKQLQLISKLLIEKGYPEKAAQLSAC